MKDTVFPDNFNCFVETKNVLNYIKGLTKIQVNSFNVLHETDGFAN